MYELLPVRFRNNKWAVRRTTWWGGFRYLSMSTLIGETVHSGKQIYWTWHKVDDFAAFQLNSITEAEELVNEYRKAHQPSVTTDYGQPCSRAMAKIPLDQE